MYFNPLNKLGVFISAELVTNTSDVNDRSHDILAHDISKLKLRFIPIVGRYDGILERSYYVPVSGDKDIAKLVYLAAKYKQESIMLVLPSNTSKLIYVADNTMKTIGKLVRSTQEECRKVAGYSVVNGIYYTTKEN